MDDSVTYVNITVLILAVLLTTCSDRLSELVGLTVVLTVTSSTLEYANRCQSLYWICGSK